MYNIPKGYKKTEIGVIPKDWKVSKLSEIARFVNGKAHENSIVKYGRYIVINSKFISTEGEIRKFSNTPIQPVKKDDVTLVMSDVPNGRAIAKSFLVDSNDRYTLNQRICALRVNPNEFYPRYLFLQLNRNPDLLAYDDGVKQTNLRKDEVLKCRIITPDRKEQQQIADTIFDIDFLITSLEKLIQKKKMIKQGVMQELLTGKRRLPGFDGDWGVDLMPNKCWYQEGPGVRTSQFTRKGVKLFNGSNIHKNKIDLDNTDRFISEKEAFGMYAHFLADQGDIVIASSGITIEKFDEKVAYIEGNHLPLCMNTSTIRFKPKEDKIEKQFIFYFLQSKSFKKQIGGQATGSAQLNFGPSHIDTVTIDFPNDIEEQRSIGMILKDIDDEIRLYEKKLSKLKSLKQGAMQQLLTGKIRLINK